MKTRMDVRSSSVKAGIISVLLLAALTLTAIQTPLLYDSLNPTSSPLVPVSPLNTSGSTAKEKLVDITGSAPSWSLVNVTDSTPTWRRVDPIFSITVAMGFDVVVLGSALLVILVFRPGRVTERERGYPKRYFVIVGGCQAVGGVMWQYSSPGERIAPYLQVLLKSMSIPVTFTMRYFVLKKRPTLLKGCCAGAILLAEIVSLIPTVVSGVETDAQRREEGGATGPWRIAWPLIRVISMVPSTFSFLTLERTVKDRLAADDSAHGQSNTFSSQIQTTDRTLGFHNPAIASSTDRLAEGHQSEVENTDSITPEVEICPSEQEGQNPVTEQKEELNIIYTLFWVYLMTFLGAASLVWADLIPGFGLVSDPALLGKQLLFNAKCMIGLEDVCGLYTILLFWGRMVTRTSQFVLSALLLRYGEGANYNVIIGVVSSPVNYLVWTLFDEQPFRWNPHTSISTWLSVAALLIILPAIVIYNKSSPEVDQNKEESTQNNSEETTPLHI